MATNEVDLIRADRTLAARFWAKVDVGGMDECWPWMAGTRAGRYGNIKVGGKRGPMVAAHRVAAVLSGRDPTGKMVLHRCDNGLCVNPRHTFEGTQAENVADMMAKGRSVHHGGLRNGNAVLTEELVREIRTRMARGEGITAICAIMGLGRTVVYSVARGRSYKGVADDVAHPRPCRIRAKPPYQKRGYPKTRMNLRSFSDEQAAQVKSMLRAGGNPQTIADQFGVSRALVYAIRHRRSYAWVPDH